MNNISQTRTKQEEANSSKKQRLGERKKKRPRLRKNALLERRTRSGNHRQGPQPWESTRARVHREHQNDLPRKVRRTGTASCPSRQKSRPNRRQRATPKASRRRCHHPQTPHPSRQTSHLPAASRTGSSRDFTSPGRNPSRATTPAVEASPPTSAVVRPLVDSWAGTGSSVCTRMAPEV